MSDIEFTFHNVGQGLFYSGEINGYRFVYDCGGDRKQRALWRAVDAYNASIPETLDMLVISHFHADHIEGLFELIRNKKVKNLVMPYFSPYERLIIACKNMDESAEYFSFLRDPASALLGQGRGPERIIIFGEHGKEHIFEEKTNPDREIGLNFDLLPNIKESKLSLDERWGSYLSDKRLLLKESTQWLDLRGIWKFGFFNQSVKESVLDNLKEQLKTVGINSSSDALAALE